MIKDTDIQYKNTLVLNMFELTKFLNFWTEYSECCGDEDVYLCKNIDGEDESHLTMIGLIPLKWKITNFNYNILENAFNTVWEYSIINSDKDKVKYIDTVIINDFETYLYKWLDNEWKYIYETLDNEIIISVRWFIPLKWFLDNEDYERLDEWWVMNSVNPKIILDRWDFLFNIYDYQNEKDIIDNEINLNLTSNYFDNEDLNYVINDIYYLRDKFENVKINLSVNIINLKENIDMNKILKKLKNHVDFLNILKKKN